MVEELKVLREDVDNLIVYIWEAIMKVDSIFIEDYTLASKVSFIAQSLEEAKDLAFELLETVDVELEEHGVVRDLFNMEDDDEEV